MAWLSLSYQPDKISVYLKKNKYIKIYCNFYFYIFNYLRLFFILLFHDLLKVNIIFSYNIQIVLDKSHEKRYL